ncbi:MAG: hypothetical protein V7L21_03010 [Nostoc sp.]
MGVLDVTYPTAIAFLSPPEKKFGKIQLHNPESLLSRLSTPEARFSISIVEVSYSNSGGHNSDTASSQPGSKSGSVRPLCNTTEAWFIG